AGMQRLRMPRLALDRLTLSSVPALPRPLRGVPGASARGRSRSHPDGADTAAQGTRALVGITLGASAIARAIRERRRLRLGLLAAIVALPLLIGGWRWFRTSSLVSVDRVQVSGVHGPDAHQI